MQYTFFKGRVALYAILKSIGIREGDEVILPGFTCVVVPNAVLYLGAKPVYADIDPETYNIDPEKIEEKITPKTRAVIAQHTFGMPAEMDAILKIGKKFDLYVIEDSCHAIGSKYKNKPVGSLSDAAFFSSQWSKPVTTGLGGWAVVNNDGLNKKMQVIYREFKIPLMKDQWILRLQYLFHSKLFRPSLYWLMKDAYHFLSERGITLGSSTDDELNCKMPADYLRTMAPWQNSLLNRKLGYISGEIEHRKKITLLYEREIKRMNLKRFAGSENCDPALLYYPLLMTGKHEILKEAKKQRIELCDWFVSPVHPNKKDWHYAGYETGSCPNAEYACNHIISLPTHQGINGEIVKKTLSFLSDFTRA